MSMTANESFTVAIGISLLLSTGIVIVIYRPLRVLLEELCPSRAGTRFWWTFSVLLLYLTPLLGSLMGFEWVPDYPTLRIVRTSIISSLLASVIALLAIGWQLASVRPKPTAPTAPSKEFWGDRAKA
jgi:hypothetical protein